ncbi:hypothetical protein BH09BAC1_BH09BAC1_10520 [soil metagenome]
MVLLDIGERYAKKFFATFGKCLQTNYNLTACFLIWNPN